MIYLTNKLSPRMLSAPDRNAQRRVATRRMGFTEARSMLRSGFTAGGMSRPFADALERKLDVNIELSDERITMAPGDKLVVVNYHGDKIDGGMFSATGYLDFTLFEVIRD